MYKLRELRRIDIPIINLWRNNKNLVDFLGAPFRYINEEVDYNWYNNYLESRTNNIRCSIVNEDDIIVGLISILSIDYINQSGVLNVMIGDSNNYNKGIGSFAIKKIIEHAFNNLNLRRIELEALESNARARHVYEKIGFIKEGVKRKAVYKNGEFVDVVMYAMLKDELR